jgi:type II secretory pathway component PulF
MHESKKLRSSKFIGGGQMKSFSYVAITTAGKQVKGTENAEDVKEFTKRMKDKGYTVTKYEEKEIEKKKTK